jgi:hypothetical protein
MTLVTHEFQACWDMAKKSKIALRKAKRTPVVALRMPTRITDRVDAWMAKEGFSTRSEAIRRLVEKALESQEKAS